MTTKNRKFVKEYFNKRKIVVIEKNAIQSIVFFKNMLDFVVNDEKFGKYFATNESELISGIIFYAS